MLFYDFDDAVMFRDAVNKNQRSYRRGKNFVNTVRGADCIIAGNRYLQDFALKVNKNTHVIPTSLDMERYRERPSSVSSDRLTLGWIGSSVTLFYLECLKNVLERVCKIFPTARLKIVADNFFDLERVPVIKKRWRYEEEIDDIHSFDIGLMPLTDDPWSRGKCGLKLLQCMATGIPVVCSPVGVNREIVQDGLNGYWAGEEREWLEKIGNLIKNSEVRHEMGRRARETVMKKFSAEVNSRRLIDLLNNYQQ
jgi:glycosyltransferase involved in cell wall biosynthesis